MTAAIVVSVLGSSRGVERKTPCRPSRLEVVVVAVVVVVVVEAVVDVVVKSAGAWDWVPDRCKIANTGVGYGVFELSIFVRHNNRWYGVRCRGRCLL